MVAAILAAASAGPQKSSAPAQNAPAPSRWRSEAASRVVPLKLRVEVDGEEYLLDLKRDGEASVYQLRGANNASSGASGSASIVETQAGVYSVLLGNRSFEVRIAQLNGAAEVWVEQRRYLISQADPRDSAAKNKGTAALGPREIRAQMPGKVINILVARG